MFGQRTVVLLSNVLLGRTTRQPATFQPVERLPWRMIAAHPAFVRAAKLHRAGRRVRIVNVVSAVVFLGPPDLVAYTTSKAGPVGFTRALATELGPADITVNAIAPGLTRTETAARTTGAAGGFERVRDLQCVPRIEEPEDLVSTLLYVCDRGSGFLTGQTINVDGGSAKH
jgi:NAD(P)-dependent dehydrogenase (short-subunit alcohol dehydrogenase family)